ncbi:hypothetical protein ACOSQ3_004538 [Xanthoceras sorbifolium]
MSKYGNLESYRRFMSSWRLLVFFMRIHFLHLGYINLQETSFPGSLCPGRNIGQIFCRRSVMKNPCLKGDKRISSWREQKAPFGSPRHKDLLNKALGCPGGVMTHAWHPTYQEAIGQRSVLATRPRGNCKGRSSSSCFAADDPIVHSILHCSLILGVRLLIHIPKNGKPHCSLLSKVCYLQKLVHVCPDFIQSFVIDDSLIKFDRLFHHD